MSKLKQKFVEFNDKHYRKIALFVLIFNLVAGAINIYLNTPVLVAIHFLIVGFEISELINYQLVELYKNLTDSMLETIKFSRNLIEDLLFERKNEKLPN